MSVPHACPAYLINLLRDTERGQFMRRQLADLGLDCRQVAAVYGADLQPAERSALYSSQLNHQGFHSPMTAGEIGCYASHQRAWAQLAADDLPMGLVLEDDVMLDPALPHLLEALQKAPPVWDMVKLIGRHREKLSRRWPLCDAWSLGRYRRVPSLASAYVLSAAGARKLLASRQPFYRPVDVDFRYWWENNLQIYALLPYPTSLAELSMQSSIGPRKPPVSMGYRWRRFRDQCIYTVASVRANWLQRFDPGMTPSNGSRSTHLEVRPDEPVA